MRSYQPFNLHLCFDLEGNNMKIIFHASLKKCIFATQLIDRFPAEAAREGICFIGLFQNNLFTNWGRWSRLEDRE